MQFHSPMKKQCTCYIERSIKWFSLGIHVQTKRKQKMKIGPQHLWPPASVVRGRQMRWLRWPGKMDDQYGPCRPMIWQSGKRPETTRDPSTGHPPFITHSHQVTRAKATGDMVVVPSPTRGLHTHWCQDMIGQQVIQDRIYHMHRLPYLPVDPQYI